MPVQGYSASIPLFSRFLLYHLSTDSIGLDAEYFTADDVRYKDIL